MLPVEFQSYSPVLRLKEGEYKAFSELSATVCDRTLPHFVLPPPQDRDPELGRILRPNEVTHIYARRVGTYWPFRPCLIDPRFLLGRLEDTETEEWLPQLFRFATAAEARAIPVATLADLEGHHRRAFYKVVRQEGHGIALRLTLDDFNRSDLAGRIHKIMLGLVLKPSECILIMDFSDAELSVPSVAAEIIVASYQSVMEIGLWYRTFFQATSYPDYNPAPSNGNALLMRNDWLAWSAAMQLDAKVKENLAFGDFGADCAKFNFKSGAAMPIRHYRYSTKNHWFVVRGDENKTALDAMRSVASRIVESGHFAGRNFSYADAFIEDTVSGTAGPGNATTWRKINTIHHLTRVVSDLGDIHGYVVPQTVRAPVAKQHNLFEGQIESS